MPTTRSQTVGALWAWVLILSSAHHGLIHAQTQPSRCRPALGEKKPPSCDPNQQDTPYKPTKPNPFVPMTEELDALIIRLLNNRYVDTCIIPCHRTRTPQLLVSDMASPIVVAIIR